MSYDNFKSFENIQEFNAETFKNYYLLRLLDLTQRKLIFFCIYIYQIFLWFLMKYLFITEQRGNFAAASCWANRDSLTKWN